MNSITKGDLYNGCLLFVKIFAKLGKKVLTFLRKRDIITNVVTAT